MFWHSTVNSKVEILYILSMYFTDSSIFKDDVLFDLRINVYMYSENKT